MKGEVRDWVVIENQGLKICGVLHKPLSPPPWPGVLLLHGFAGNKIGRTRQYVELGQALAERGMVSLRIDFRGCGDSEGEFEERHFTDHIDDGLVALNHLAKLEGVDRERLGVVGRSLGAPIAVETVRHYGPVKSIALWAAVSTCDSWRMKWEAFEKAPQVPDVTHINNIPFHSKFLRNFFHEFFDMDPMKGMKDLGNTPFLHVHGAKDTVVGSEHVEEYRKFRDKATAESQFLELPNCDHDFFEPGEQSLVIKETADWFARTL